MVHMQREEATARLVWPSQTASMKSTEESGDLGPSPVIVRSQVREGEGEGELRSRMRLRMRRLLWSVGQQKRGCRVTSARKHDSVKAWAAGKMWVAVSRQDPKSSRSQATQSSIRAVEEDGGHSCWKLAVGTWVLIFRRGGGCGVKH